jgi:PAS domain S-box-containing protein
MAEHPSKSGRVIGHMLLFGVLLLVLGTLSAHAASADAQNSADGRMGVKPKHILVLCAYGYALPAYQKFNPAFLSVVEKEGAGTYDTYFEYLDLLRNPKKEHRLFAASILRDKYGLVKIDLIVTMHAPAMNFLLNEAKNLFPNVPVISWTGPEPFEKQDPEHRFFRLAISLDIQGTLERMLQLFPRTRRVLFVTGASAIDRQTEDEGRTVFAGWQNQLQFETTSQLSLEAMLDKVASLPPHSLVLFGGFFQDTAGQAFVSRFVAQMVISKANAPVFGLNDTLLGLGIVGGSLLSFEAEGVRTATLAIDILNGKVSQTEQAEPLAGKPVAIFDWQQIEKWGGKAGKLAKGSMFINRGPSLWERYAWHLIGFLGFLLVQLLLITALWVQSYRRGRAEEKLKLSAETLERRVVERTARLQESEARYRSLFSSMTEGFALHEIITGADGKPCDYRFLEINPAFERLTGLKREAVLGKTVREVIPNIEAYWIETYGRVALEGAPIQIENYSAALNRWYEVMAYFAAPGQFAVLFSDITGSKLAKEALQRSEERLKRAQEIAHLGSWELDLEKNELTWSDEVYRIFGSQPQKFAATYEAFLASVHPDDRQKVDDAYSGSVRDNQDSYEIEHRVVRPDGKIRYVHEKCQHYRDHSGRIIRSIGMVHDITGRKQAEQELRESEERLRGSLVEKEVLLKEIHHRVKNNMQVISSLVSLQANEVTDGAMRAILQDVTHRVRSMAMVHEKLYQSADLACIEFAEYAKSLLIYLWRAHGTAASGVGLDLDLSPVPLPVNEAVPCGLILNELFSNALKHAFHGRNSGRVTVALTSGDQGRVRLCVADNGCGLPAGFDWQKPKSLGLRLVQMLAAQLHAAIEVAGDNGTEFTITFRRTQI